MILCGLVFERLAQEKRVFVVYLIPVFAVANVQRRFNVAQAFLVPEVDLRRTHKQPQCFQSSGDNLCRQLLLFVINEAERLQIKRVCGYLMVNRSGAGAVEFMIGSHDVCEVYVPLAPHSLRCVALLMEVASVSCREAQIKQESNDISDIWY